MKYTHSYISMRRGIKEPLCICFQARTAVSYVPSSGAVQFQDGSRFGIKQIDIDDSVSITHGSTFTATLTNATYIGVGGKLGSYMFSSDLLSFKTSNNHPTLILAFYLTTALYSMSTMHRQRLPQQNNLNKLLL